MTYFGVFFSFLFLEEEINILNHQWFKASPEPKEKSTAHCFPAADSHCCYLDRRLRQVGRAMLCCGHDLLITPST